MIHNKNFFYKAFAVLVIAFVISIIYDLAKSNMDDATIKKYDIQLSGIIYAKKKLRAGHDYGYAGLNIVKSNYDNFDERGKTDRFLFIVEGNRCVIALPRISAFEINDS